MSVAGLRRHVSWIIVVVVALMGVSSVVTYIATRQDEFRLRDYISVTRDVRLLQIAMLDIQSGVRGVVLSADPTAFATYVHGMAKLQGTNQGVFAVIDKFAVDNGQMSGSAAPVSGSLAHLTDAWARAVMLGMDHNQAAAEDVLVKAQTVPAMSQLQSVIGDYLAYRSGKVDAGWARIGRQQDLILIINLLGAAITIAATSYAFAASRREARRREEAMRVSQSARREVETLFGMTEVLQSATTSDDANAVLRATAAELLPECGGALYVFNNSRDRLDFAVEWGPQGASPAPLHIAPDSCWALKRGKPHLNAADTHALRCAHSDCATTAFEIPIVARGEVHGLLVLRGAVLKDAAVLRQAQPVALALADAMSLALSNIALRERLRNQALRDPLTGLYNRRFLEEMLERLTTDAERRRAPVAAIMMDLDHFKKLNDRHGHSVGDLVLRDAATAMLSCLQAADIACRYGGEEFAILMPDTPLEAAVARAEQIRAKIGTLTSNDLSVSASFGVAGMPETCGRPAELLPTADAALYLAKDRGRDRVVAAPLRPSAEMIQLSQIGWDLPEKRAGD